MKRVSRTHGGTFLRQVWYVIGFWAIMRKIKHVDKRRYKNPTPATAVGVGNNITLHNTVIRLLTIYTFVLILTPTARRRCSPCMNPSSLHSWPSCTCRTAAVADAVLYCLPDWSPPTPLSWSVYGYEIGFKVYAPPAVRPSIILARGRRSERWSSARSATLVPEVGSTYSRLWPLFSGHGHPGSEGRELWMEPRTPVTLTNENTCATSKSVLWRCSKHTEE